MKRSDLYILKNLAGADYLLPVGQKAAMFPKSIRLNETGRFLWEQLRTEKSEEELAKTCAEHFEVPDGQYEQVKNDVHVFTEALWARGMLKADSEISGSGNSDKDIKKDLYECRFDSKDGSIKELSEELPHYADLLIGGRIISFWGDEKYFSKEFDIFKTEENKCGMRIEIIPVKVDGKTDSGHRMIGLGNCSENVYRDYPKSVLRHPDLNVQEYENKYVLFLWCMKDIYEIHMKKDGSLARFYCKDISGLEEDIFYAIRLVFLVYALKQDLIMLHSVSILYNDKAWLFSASSGTGKSTHAEIWKKIYGTPVINGDLNLIGIKDGTPVIYGTPWCGTSGVCDNLIHNLGGIVLLKRGDNIIEELSEEQKMLYLQKRLTSPVWNEEMLDKELEILKEIIPKVYIKRYYCNMKDETVKHIREDIDIWEKKIE
ncbi:MAG: PqqD family protein [Lachnospiraceae bacterium]|nr:PqqD family protein [Lachnospiraceae bacterium]